MNIKVINEAEKELNVAVNNLNDGTVQITISSLNRQIDLLSLNPGDVFEVNNVEYIVLEQLENHLTAVIRKELLDESMKFDSDINNNWKTSDIRKYLNEEYFNEIEKSFLKNKIVEHSIDLLSMDGLDDYGMSTDRVSLLTIDQYRKYRKILYDNLNDKWWLITPYSTPSGIGDDYVQCVHNNGDVDYCNCCYYMGVRPFFIIQS